MISNPVQLPVHSAIVQMSLRFSDGRSATVAQSGPRFVVLGEPASFAMEEGEEVMLAISVDGVMSEARMRVARAVIVEAEEVLVGTWRGNNG